MMQTKIDEPKYKRKSLKRKRIKGADEISKKKKEKSSYINCMIEILILLLYK